MQHENTFFTTCEAADDFLDGFRQAAVDACIPLRVQLELTQRCNLSCVHCYTVPTASQARREMSTAEVTGMLDELTELGCLELTFTGGEPLLRADFAHLYRYAREKGFLVSVFTNATRVNDEIVALLKRFPPVRVDVSVYGATAETYERVTKKAGSYRACIEGLRRLAEGGIALSLKTVLMKINLHEFDALGQLAARFGARLRHDTALFARLDGDRSPLDLRVACEEAVAADFSGEKRREEWHRLRRRAASRPQNRRLYFCGAGRSACHINAYGLMQPCLVTANVQHDVRILGTAEAWRRVHAEVEEKSLERDGPCWQCHKRHLCLNCPGYAWLETGDEGGLVPYLCATAGLRYEYLNADRHSETQYAIDTHKR